MLKRQILDKHRWGQALVEKEIRTDGARVIKDYGKCGFPGALVYGTIIPRREYRALRNLSSHEGIPQKPRLESPHIVSYDYLKGVPLRESDESTPLSRSFFTRLWELVTHIHLNGFVHLDLGNRGNILILDNGSPAIIDFASCTSTRHFPNKLRQTLERRDKLGVLKLWHRYAPETVPPTLNRYFTRYYHKNLATPGRLYKETRHCLHSHWSSSECGRVRRIWIIISLALSLAATVGALSR
jgi:RIO-like serine/threonine protein kinase